MGTFWRTQRQFILQDLKEFENPFEKQHKK